MGRTKNSTTKKEASRKLSTTHRPKDMTLEEWQIGLRRQMARSERFSLSAAKSIGSVYMLTNLKSGNEYKVVYHGEGSVWNYCSCMDFRTNQLGTCKHIEAVADTYRKDKREPLTCKRPYTSIFLSYKKGRSIRLRIGCEKTQQFFELSRPYFTADGLLRKGAENKLHKFIEQAARLSSDFRIYPDALDYITNLRDRKMREKMASEITDADLQKLLHAKLYPYQKEGILFAFQAGRSIIADEMGLGKTIQAIGVAELMFSRGLVSSVLIVCPTSLKYQWKKEIEKFTDSTVSVIEGGHLQRREQYKGDAFYKIVSYNCISNDIKIMKRIDGFDLIVFDEVQRLKNWNTQISKGARKLKSDYVVALSGTPLENKLEELYSIMQLVDQYALGPLYRFMDNSIITNDNGKIVGYRNLNAIGKKIAPVLKRRTKAQVALQLPARMDKVLFVPMTNDQRGIHEEFKSTLAQIIHKWKRFHFLSETDRKRMLLIMSQMRMVCDSTYILDQKTRHDTKVDEIINIVRDTVESGDEKIVIFSQWERMTRIIAAELDKTGVKYEYLHGGVPSFKRRELTENFTDNPESRVFISTDAGSTGLNLQVASIIINVDLPWNPAVLEQRIGRIYRLGQQRNIQVINLVSSDSIEERMLSTLHFKTNLFQGILDDGEDTVFLDNSKLEKIMDIVNGFATEEESVIPENQEELSEKEPDIFTVLNDETESEEKADEFEDYRDEYWDEPTSDEEPAPENTNTEVKVSASEEKQPGSVAHSGANKRSDIHDATDAQKLVKEGISFLSGLSKTLKSPEATRQLVDTIVKTDPQTGQTSINIPIPDKDTVTNLFNLLGKLL